MVTKETFHARPKIYCTGPALEIMVEECTWWHARGVECGASLVGVERDGFVLILYAARTGPNARKSPGRVTTDADYQNLIIQAIMDSCPGVCIKYLGDYHLHPMPLDSLSPTDNRAIATILYDPDHRNLSNLAVLLFSTQGKDTLQLNAFTASRDEDGHGVAIRPAFPQIVSPDHPRVGDALRGFPYLHIDEVEASVSDQTSLRSFLSDPGFIRISQRRIRLDIAELTRKLRWETKRVSLDPAGALVEGRVNGDRFLFIFPPEYPLNGPLLLYGNENRQEYREFQYSHNWTSLSSPLDLIRQFLEEIPNGTCPQSHDFGQGDASSPSGEDSELTGASAAPHGEAGAQ